VELTAKGIKIQNIENLGYKVGTGVRGKGTKIYLTSRYFKSFWSVDENNFKYLVKQMKKENVKLDELYIQSGSYLKDGNIVSFSFGENYQDAETQFNLKELVKTNFKGIEECHIYHKPKTVGYFPLSKYDTDKLSQLQMCEDFIKQFDEVELYGDFEDTNWSYDCMEFPHIDSEGDRYDGDYQQYHGNSCYTEDRGDCEYVNGRINNENDTVLDDFWAFGPDEGGWLNEVDPNDTISVYARKGKDWYIGHTLEEREFYISYEDDYRGFIKEEEFYALVYQPNEELKQKVVDIVKSWKNDVETKGYIYNQLNKEYDNSVVNFQVAEMLFEDIFDFRDEIIDKIQNWDYRVIEEEFLSAYLNVIEEKVKILNDKTVEITYIPNQYGDEKPKQKRYNHLKKIERFEKVFGYELVYSSIYENNSPQAYAIKKDGEEYHFNIAEVIANDIAGEQTLRNAIKEMLEFLEKRKLETMAQNELFEKASHVFVGIKDSLESGNCKFGTDEFLRKYHINTSKIGGIRGDELLKLEMSNFTKRAVIHAIASHNHVA